MTSPGGRWGRRPPPGPFRPDRWRSPIRGPWLTSVLSVVLLVGIPIMFSTGILSYAAYEPWLDGNDLTPDKGILGPFLSGWPTDPHWLFRLNQGIHVMLGLALVPVLLAKLWSVIPKFYGWPPVESPAQLVERASLVLVVGGAIFEFATGIVNIQYWYVFPGSFYDLHLYGAWVFTAALVTHVTFKLPALIRSLGRGGFARGFRADLAHTEPEPDEGSGLVATDPRPATISRRGALAMIGAGSLLVVGLAVGQTVTSLRRFAVLAPRGQTLGSGPNDFQVNKTAKARGIRPSDVGPSWGLSVRGERDVRLSRPELLAMPQRRAELAIDCVEGWSTGVQSWTGVSLADLAALVGAPDGATVVVSSLQSRGPFGSAHLSADEVRDPRCLLALGVNGVPLSLDHGFPARIVVPAGPGVHDTKWVKELRFV